MAGVNRVSRRPHPAPLPDQSGTYQALGQLDGAASPYSPGRFCGLRDFRIPRQEPTLNYGAAQFAGPSCVVIPVKLLLLSCAGTQFGSYTAVAELVPMLVKLLPDTTRLLLP
jgi:hypothetical protein